jgi:hypothetical protein
MIGVTSVSRRNRDRSELIVSIQKTLFPHVHEKYGFTALMRAIRER